MANRNFQNNMYHMERAVVKLFAEVAFVAGAPTLVKGNGITDVTGSLGDYLVTLDDKYYKMLMFQAMPMSAVNDMSVQLKEEDVKVAGTFSFLLKDGGLLQAPDVDGTVFLEITLKNSTMDY